MSYTFSLSLCSSELYLFSLTLQQRQLLFCFCDHLHVPLNTVFNALVWREGDVVCAEWSMYTDGTDFVLYSVDQLSPTGFHHSVLDRIQYPVVAYCYQSRIGR